MICQIRDANQRSDMTYVTSSIVPYPFKALNSRSASKDESGLVYSLNNIIIKT